MSLRVKKGSVDAPTEGDLGSTHMAACWGLSGKRDLRLFKKVTKEAACAGHLGRRLRSVLGVVGGTGTVW